ncbi:hypothetical protein Aab01nite_84440 [Paractinoplanes abujensis]|uniref:Uncharacterized protein n=1 Tax=Paractinoplanes abujensis TaxID=882441 RepID=A0A7W7G1U3_9ACTN|nr:hypothetical protein [Actinoplanes abujensis]MBB4693067.1 hypothetical protein [Actinoplanes abujensis]GID24854.1 hypothetical protein Aab01nite_84440 [Actinoplanes abujensis]
MTSPFASTRNQEKYIEQATANVWRLEQQVTGGHVRHGLLAVRTMAALSDAIYGRLAAPAGLPDDQAPLVADNTDQFSRVRRSADGLGALPSQRPAVRSHDRLGWRRSPVTSKGR